MLEFLQLSQCHQKLFPHPKLKRSDESTFDKGNFIAKRTGDGNPEPELHADPVETETPSISRAINNDSPLAPSKPQFRVFGRQFSIHP